MLLISKSNTNTCEHLFSKALWGVVDNSEIYIEKFWSICHKLLISLYSQYINPAGGRPLKPS